MLACTNTRFRHRKIRQEFDAPSPSIGGLAWIWALGKTAHLSGTEALPPVTPRTGALSWGNWLGERAWGCLGCGVAEPNMHARTGSKTKGNNKLMS